MSLFDAELFAAMQVVSLNAAATNKAVVEAVRAVNATDRDELRRQVEKLAEFHRLFAVRLESMISQLREAR